MSKKKSSPQPIVSDDDEMNKIYNESFKKGLAMGDWVVQMLKIPNTPFIIPVNPHDRSSEIGDVGYNGWRDGFDEAMAQYMELEDVTIHEIMLSYARRRFNAK